MTRFFCDLVGALAFFGGLFVFYAFIAIVTP